MLGLATGQWSTVYHCSLNIHIHKYVAATYIIPALQVVQYVHVLDKIIHNTTACTAHVSLSVQCVTVKFIAPSTGSPPRDSYCLELMTL